MNPGPQEFQREFVDFVSWIRSVVQQRRGDPHFAPRRYQIEQWKVTGLEQTSTGVKPTNAETILVEKVDWTLAAKECLCEIAMTKPYQALHEGLSSVGGEKGADLLKRATERMLLMALEGENLKAEELWTYFLQVHTQEAVASWSESDLYGVAVENAEFVEFSCEGEHFIFRQLQKSDFEEELRGISPVFRSIGNPSDSILRIEIPARSPVQHQDELLKAEVILRLYQVCSSKLERTTFATPNPFSFPGSTQFTTDPKRATHSINIRPESVTMLQNFWSSVWAKLPKELYGSNQKRTTAVSIAYERYCDSLFATAADEKKVAFAIMGLEAIYLGEHEVQELMYRMELRVTKIMSKLGMLSNQVRERVKEGYRIRNTYVHGGHLSEKDVTKLNKKGLSLDSLALSLLDYLRISIVHLILSEQEKGRFLEAIEAGFIEHRADAELQWMLDAEKDFLLGRTKDRLGGAAK